MKMHYVRSIMLFTLLSTLSGCAGMVADSFMRPTMANLQRQTDIDLVCEGTPAFLLMLDSMIASDPDDKQLLLTGTQAFSGYAAALYECGNQERAAVVSNKAKLYGLSLLWDDKDPNRIRTLPLPELEYFLQNIHKSDVDRLFWAGNGWFSWILHQQGSPASMAELVRVEKIMLRVLELEDSYHYGGAHLFLGAYYGSRTKLLGGNPEISRRHFERALTIGSRQFLPALVLYARTYAKTTFDRQLFTRLLQEVLDFPLESRPDLALTNQIAKRQAARLLDQTDQFF